MPQISLERITFGFPVALFKDISLTIGAFDRIGVVGNNGCGKSTFLKCIAGLIEPQEGRITHPKGLKFGFIEQTLPESLKHVGFYQALESAIAPSERDYLSWKIDYTFDTFKVPKAMRTRPISELSGGWQRIALIARAVLSDPDVLLLDEPTNHLDVNKIILLETWLNEQVSDIPLLTVSHDRSFLETCTKKTLFLRGTEILSYDYPYGRAIELLREDDKAKSLQYKKESKEIKRLKESAHLLRQIGINKHSGAALRKSNQIAKRADNIEQKITHVHTDEKRVIKLDANYLNAKSIFRLNQVKVNTPNGLLLFNISELEIRQGERVVIFGENGSGKSQLLSMLYSCVGNSNEAERQGVRITPSIKLGYVDQQLSQLPNRLSLYDYLQERVNNHQKTTSSLIQAGFPVAMHQTLLSQLSPGERSRISFLALHLMQLNVYILDEPTNHLDIEGQEQLESELIKQGATVIVVSHDRKFIEAIGTRFYMIQNQRLVSIDSPEIYYQNLSKSKGIDDEITNKNQFRKR